MNQEQNNRLRLEVIEAAEFGGRRPEGLARKVLLGTALAWALFQLWVASPLPFNLGIGVFNDTEVRSIHLAFAIFLAYLSFPRRRMITHTIPVVDWLLAFVALCCALYLFLFYETLAARSGAPTPWDVAISMLGLLLLLEATRRALGWPLMVIGLFFLGYTFGGPWLPDLLAHKGASLSRVASHQWLSTEGVFGVAVGVSAGFVFLFVLFGSLLEQAGGGHYFIRVAYALVGHLRGGPAKAAVLASGLTGMVSGSSIANVVTTGTFTIPLMKRVGFSAERSGAIEVAASTNGQIMPPVMGAAAFLMVEYLNISYLEVIKHAFLPAVLSYIGLMYLVHLEAVKAGMEAERRAVANRIKRRLLGWGLTLSGVGCFLFFAYWLLETVNSLFGSYGFYVNAGLILLLYVLLIYCEVRCGLRAEERESSAQMTVATALLGGLHFLLPILVLVWCLILLRLSPASAVFYAICLMMVIQLSQEGLRELFQGGSPSRGIQRGLQSLVVGLENGSRNMIGIGVATATAGIVVGTVSLTGIGQVMGELVEALSLGSVVLMLLLTALICMILGMGLPTTANYIVVSTLMAPVIVQLSAAHGLDVPLVAVHMFVFYFGILADDTPPVGLAAYAAAGISGGDPIRTGLQSFYYDIRTAVLPFMFIFNTSLLMIGIDSLVELLMVVSQGVVAMLLFVSATQGWLLVRNRLWESLVLLLVVFSLFRPDFWQEYLYPGKVWQPVGDIETYIDSLPADAKVRLQVEVEDEEGRMKPREILLRKPEARSGDYLESLGFITEPDGDTLRVIDVGFLSAAEQAGLTAGFNHRITGYYRQRRQPHSSWFLIPPLLLLGAVLWLQYRRGQRQQQTTLGV
ncbi:MAG: TRAP transporter permease [Candidatus Thiodiazotropha sp. (ex Ctena orbiculata)]|nr:TRAP transporter permease [Candidatus Thiodiazotropha taylori]MBT2995766.1 TRAP transporter permease [Candidatus Thiodiazotropha taylori]MBT2999081.1 TRAP transporter permease [Candidatus Thiodiazotropha taylori]MBV2108639.1 TRAP transporter permease [Candidatus Thiodiazotropha taylori]MBV2112339.1 TRAP transporter permease [Candidatus Thiodiazotropha taylori]